MAGRTAEFITGEVINVQVPRSQSDIEMRLKPFFTGKTVVLSTFPESAWTWQEGTVLEPRVQPINIRERILYTFLGPQMRVKVGEDTRIVSASLVRKISTQTKS